MNDTVQRWTGDLENSNATPSRALQHEERNWEKELQWLSRRHALNENLPPGVLVRELWWLCVDWPKEPDLVPGDFPVLAAERFERVSLEGCLQYCGDPRAVLAHWWCLVAPRGKLVVLVPDDRLSGIDAARQSWRATRPKWRFGFQGASERSPHTLNLVELAAALPECHIDVIKGCGMHEVTDRERTTSMMDFGVGYLLLEAHRSSQS